MLESVRSVRTIHADLLHGIEWGLTLLFTIEYILATGGIYSIPEIPGIDSGKVVGAADLNRRLKTYLKFAGPGLLSWATKFWMPIGGSLKSRHIITGLKMTTSASETSSPQGFSPLTAA